MTALLDDDKVIGHQTPSSDVIKVLDLILKSRKSAAVAEVGLGLGATTRAIAERMNGRGELHLFDYEERTRKIVQALERQGLSRGLKIVAHGNTRRTYDSYAWRLATLALDEVERGGEGIYDLAYLDGAHAFYHDAPACAALRELIRPNGYLVLDDVHWTFASSPSLNPARNSSIVEKYTQEQIETPHVRVVDRLLMKTDRRFEQVLLSDDKNPPRTIYKKLGRAPWWSRFRPT